MTYNFDEIVDRRNTDTYKWDRNEIFFKRTDIIPMWIADMDFKTPEPVIEALRQRVEHGVFGYTMTPLRYYETVISWVKNRYQWDIEKDWIVFYPGIVPALNISVLTLTEPGGKIVIQPPVYPPFISAVKDHGRTILYNEMIYNKGRYEMDFDDLERKFREGARMLIFCSPQNPVGRVWSEDELNKLMGLCQEYDVTVVSDEIHADFIFPGHRHIPLAKCTGSVSPKIITGFAPSKTFNIPGLQAAAIIIPNEDIRQKFKKFIDNLHINSCSLLGMVAMDAAYAAGGPWLEELITYLYANQHFLLDYFRTDIPVIKPVKSEGTYLVWLNCRQMGLNTEQLKDFMTNKARVGLSDGVGFGPGGEGFMRLNMGCTKSTLIEGLNRIKQACDSL